MTFRKINRLVQVDFDGTRHVENKIVSVEFINGSSISVEPNPILENTLTINYLTELAGDCEISVFNLNGQLLHRKTETADKGSNHFSMKLPGLPNGVYIVRLGRLDDLQTVRFVKAR